MGGLAVVAGVLKAVTTVASISQQAQAEEKQEQLLNLRLKQERAASNERTLANSRRLNSIIGQQRAMQAARGLSLSSGSFIAIQKNDFNRFNEDLNAEALNLSFAETNIAVSKDIASAQEQAGIINTLSQTSLDVFKLSRNPLGAGTATAGITTGKKGL